MHKSNNNKRTTTSLDEFLIVLREHEIQTFSKFVCIRSDKSFSEAKFTPTEKRKILWNGDIPQYCIGHRVYACHQGKDNGHCQKKKYAEMRDSKAYYTKRRNLTKPTKKLGCPALINVTRMLALPRFKVSKITNWEKTKMSEAIKGKIEAGEEIAGENVYSFNLPDETSHQNHIMGLTAAVKETIDPSIRCKIKELFSQGEHNISIITALVEQYVVNEIGETDKLRSRFYPKRAHIRSIVNAAKREIIRIIDLGNAEQLVKKWKEKSEVISGIYFRPCTLQQNPSKKQKLSKKCTQREESDDECAEENQAQRWMQTLSNHLLFVYQSKQMKYLYYRYGKDGVLLDATYKTCKWALPLYFLAVKANVGYQPVAVFITQYKTQQSIFEALNIIKQWNPDVILKFAMVDFAMEEILAVESVFPGIEVFISTFHREHTWTRWSSEANIGSFVQRQEALKKLRAIANAPTEKTLQEAVEEMLRWNHYDNSPLKIYFERTWLPEIKRWTLAYKPPGLLFHTDNGVEQINEELKYLMESKNCSLSEMMNIIVTHFLPDRYKSYVCKNICMMSTHKNSEDIPEFLHNRPKWIVSFVKEKMVFLNAEDTNQLIVNKLTQTSYEVSSLTYKNVSYKVNCNDTTTCSCEDFVRNRFLCKHMILISKKFPEFNIGTLILKNEVFRIDENVVNFQTVSTSNTPNKPMDEDVPNEHEDEECAEEDEDEECAEEDEDVSNDLTFCPSEQQDYAKLAMRNVVNLQTKSTSKTPIKPMDEDVTNDLPFCSSDRHDYAKRATKKSKKKKLIAECNSTYRSLQSAMWMFEEKYLEKLRNELQHLYEDATLHVTANGDTASPIETSDSSNTKTKTLHQYAALVKPENRNVKQFVHVDDTKKPEMKRLNTMLNQDNNKNESFDNTPLSNITDYHEITVFLESINNITNTVDINTSNSTNPPKKKLKSDG